MSPENPGLVSSFYKEKGVSEEELKRRAAETEQQLAANEAAASREEAERKERAEPLARELAQMIVDQLNEGLDKETGVVTGKSKQLLEDELRIMAAKMIRAEAKYEEVKPSEVLDKLRFGTIQNGNTGDFLIGSISLTENSPQ